MEKKFDVIALGELLIDFTENGVSAQGNPIFEANPGGAPCNVLAMLNNLGKKTSFLGVVGKDQFGTSLRKTLNELKIDTSHLYENQEVHTTLAFVHTFEDGDRDFAFYRNPGADMMLSESQVEKEYLESAKAFHFGTLSMTHEEVRKATQKAITIAKEAGMLISFDPNLRPPLWSSMELAKEQIAYGLGQCDLLKISEEELEFMTGTKDIKEGAHKLLADYPNLKLMNVTMGKEGSRVLTDKEDIKVEALKVNAVDTTGAGDTYIGYFVRGIVEEMPLLETAQMATKASAIAVTRFGAVDSIPNYEEVFE